MKLSNELQIGKAGEHLVCADLIAQGYNAFLSDQGLPYDVVVDLNGRMIRVQVKTTTSLVFYAHAKDVYRFGTRRAKNSRAPVREKDVDYFAFVALDIRKIAYIPIKDMIARTGRVKQTVDFKTRRIKYVGRVYQNGTRRTPEWGRHLEDYSEFRV
ncbi:group I intron-associated PD-(D/E)XK endonuclease [Paenibacillus apiarius]|uniref:Group I intron-associated PD-(D/E)XK endonuclease n=1 Tax=Paenibacillus apiarius TaxID=46240 RepID=A0ABT4DVI9_9BACL|nr:group I intron-associated PD-(D/E)XK endonuclease [Paenibacillus apiarius]MCY9513282.1 group I intron-associated PD-(D/E)XK endonuclease [Paenibacillus apiarius]MCY9521359.1 group I intron-associated PD-(D/E)XK endonuclease [Paenibacillus apiarius]MCY9554495.1 group I intron-associated PD-(D/E)XK endonuclease [Paenibacillus apiarius]MCY9560698.1 group I intron-associated PD-(D/E)XK endonuclease [Paenibacillus apiarius]MCY9685051.1 group I intron-associated PD-(D/E)XK endonuclease [Paenibaci